MRSRRWRDRCRSRGRSTRSPGARSEKPAQHVVADSRSEQRRRDGFVSRVGVELGVEVLGLLGERRRGPQVEVAARRVERALAPAAARAAVRRARCVRGSPGTRRCRRGWTRSSSAHRGVEHRVEPLRPACPRVVGRERAGGVPEATRVRQGRAARRSSALASAGASPGGTNTAVSVVSTSRSAGRSDATIGRPSCRYSNSFSGDVNRSEIAEAVLGRTSIVAFDREAATLRLGPRAR